ncbi:MAG: sensor histidine kinase [Ardenticatenaceae bacterium]
MSVKILVVDDEPKLEKLVKQIFRRQIRREKWQLMFAQDGLEALEVLQAEPEIAVILLDINMPRMDGLTFLVKLKTLEGSFNPALTSVIVSAYSDMKNIRKAMNEGAFDFVTKPLDLEDLRVTVLKTIQHSLALKKTYQEKRQAEEALREANEALRRANEELDLRVQKRTAELFNANRALKSSNAELEAFAHTVAHDLKSPLAGILCFTQIIQAGLPALSAEQIRQYIELIEKSGEQATKIVEELLLLATIRKMQIAETAKETINMTQVMAQVMDRLALIIEEYQAELITPEAWPVAIGYAPWIEQVWLNYLSNGIKYGGRPPRVWIGATKIDDLIRFWVRDNGPGIEPQAQAALFREFSRLGERKVEGTGLGLSIVKRIVEKLGGEVGVKSEIGRGSEFYFTLPSRFPNGTP